MANVSEQYWLARYLSAAVHIILFTKPDKELTLPRFIGSCLTWVAAIITVVVIIYVKPDKDSAFWLDLIIGLLGLIASVRIGEGVILSRTQLHTLQTAGNDHKLLRHIRALLIDASQYCLQGVTILVWAFVLQLIKIAIQ